MRCSRLFVLLLSALPLLCAGQPVYRLGKLDGLGLGLGLGASLTGWVLSTQAESYQGVLPLSPAQVNGLDRFATRRWSPWWQSASDYSAILSVQSCVLAVASRPVRRELATIAVMGLETGLWLYGLGATTKALSLRPRPFMYGTLAPTDVQREKDARFSFFSLHTGMTAGASFFTAKVLHDLHPDARWRKWVWTGAALAPLGVGVMRVLGGKHFPTDVVVGYALGVGVGLLVPELHRVRTRAAALEVYPSAGGLGLAWRF
jgi:membrane-associated phospholipid phosphatase